MISAKRVFPQVILAEGLAEGLGGISPLAKGPGDHVHDRSTTVLQRNRYSEHGEEPPSMDVSRDEWARRWTSSKRSSGTGATYTRTITAWFAFLDRLGVEWHEVEQHHVDEYRHTMSGLSPATVARHLATVSSFYRHVLRHGRPAPLDRNPVEYADRPKVDIVSRRAGLTKDEAVALQRAAAERGPRAAALVHLLLGTAVRVSEAVEADVAGLGWNDEGDRTLAVVRKGGMHDVVVIEPDDWQVIDHYLQTRGDVPGGYLFATTGGRRMSRQTAYREVRAIADGVVDKRKKIGPHSLRHTFATLALDDGLAIQVVQAALRHSSSATTQRYDRNLRERGRDAAKAVARARQTSKEETT